MPSALLADLPTEIADWSTLTTCQDLFRRAEKTEEWVFRGLPSDVCPKSVQTTGTTSVCPSDDISELKTTLEEVVRQFKVESKWIQDLEYRLLFEFMRRYHLYAVEPPPRLGDTLDWLALMRHHGAPCRLLDVTFSFLVAAYFALDRQSDGMARIWAINKTWLSEEGGRIVARRSKTMRAQFNNYRRHRDGNAFRQVFLRSNPPRLVYPVSPFRLNERLTIQQGAFLCLGDVTKSFSDNLRVMRNYKDNVISIPIRPEARRELLVGLMRANLTQATLFPGLDGFARSLWTRVEFLEGLRSMEDSGARTKVNLDLKSLERW